MNKILITGGAGFLGSHLTEKLLKEGNDVLVVDNYYTGSKSNIEDLMSSSNFEILRHDVTLPLFVEVDAIVNMLEAQLESASLTKAELARRLDMESANIRRLFTSSTNPTIATISDIAFELGLELQLVPIVKTTRSHGINLVRTRMTPMRDSRTPRKAIPANA